MADLITLARAQSALASDLTPAQLATIPTLITAASRAIERYCCRTFTATDFDVIRVPTPAPQFTAQADTVMLENLPLNSVSRVASGRSSAILIRNTLTSIQRAIAQLNMTGDPEVQLTTSGITLTTVTSGTPTTTILTWASYATLSSLATAINAIGSGWVATVPTSFAQWPTSELVSREGPLGCLGSGASFDVFATDLQILDVDRRSGSVSFASYGSSPGSTLPYDAGFIGADTDVAWGVWRPQVRVLYNAGYSTIPDDVQQACAVTVQSMYADQQITSGYRAEKLGDYSYERDAVVGWITDAARALLAPYRIRRA